VTDRPIYLALGDSISIDKYTGVSDGGAVSQFARLLNAAQLQDLTEDGCRTVETLEWLSRINVDPDVITVTLGGNDLLEAGFFRTGKPGTAPQTVTSVAPILDRLASVYTHIEGYGATVITNTVYDPTDGDDDKASALGLDPTSRDLLHALNEGIRQLSDRHGFLTCDLRALFHGHGFWSEDPWIVLHIEPNLAGATAIAQEWHRLYKEINHSLPR
jgi:lysophospholipase L1-like esterase